MTPPTCAHCGERVTSHRVTIGVHGDPAAPVVHGRCYRAYVAARADR